MAILLGNFTDTVGEAKLALAAAGGGVGCRVAGAVEGFEEAVWVIAVR